MTQLSLQSPLHSPHAQTDSALCVLGHSSFLLSPKAFHLCFFLQKNPIINIKKVTSLTTISIILAYNIYFGNSGIIISNVCIYRCHKRKQNQLQK